MSTLLPRRRFLQTAASAMVAAKPIRLASSVVDTARENTRPSDRLRFAIVGVGMQGSGLLKNALTLPSVECVGAADL